MPHFHIPNQNEKFYHTPGFVNCFNRHRCKRKAPSSPFLPGQPSSSGLTVSIYPTNTIEVKLINGKTLKTSKYFKALLEAIRSSPFYVENVDDACLLVPNIDPLVNGTVPFCRKSIEILNTEQWLNQLFNKHDDPNVIRHGRL